MESPDKLQTGPSCWYHYCDGNAAFTRHHSGKPSKLRVQALSSHLPRKRSVPIATDVLAGAGTDMFRALQITSSKGHPTRFGIWSLGFLWSIYALCAPRRAKGTLRSTLGCS